MPTYKKKRVLTTFSGEMVGEALIDNTTGSPVTVSRDYIPDDLGSVVALISGSASTSETFDYWPYGELKARTGSYNTPYLYCGTLGYYADFAADASFYVGSRVAYPVSDGTRGGWTGPSGQTANLYQFIDDPIDAPSDSDYIQRTPTAFYASSNFTIGSLANPTSYTVYKLNWRYALGHSAGGGIPAYNAIDLKFELFQGSTLIATSEHIGLTSSAFNADSYVLSVGEAGSITDFAALSIRVSARQNGDDNVNTVLVSAVNFEASPLPYPRYYVRARHYRPDLGRWMTVDPLYPAERPYRYSFNSPTNWNDPLGLGCGGKQFGNALDAFSVLPLLGFVGSGPSVAEGVAVSNLTGAAASAGAASAGAGAAYGEALTIVAAWGVAIVLTAGGYAIYDVTRYAFTGETGFFTGLGDSIASGIFYNDDPSYQEAEYAGVNVAGDDLIDAYLALHPNATLPTLNPRSEETSFTLNLHRQKFANSHPHASAPMVRPKVRPLDVPFPKTEAEAKKLTKDKCKTNPRSCDDLTKKRCRKIPIHERCCTALEYLARNYECIIARLYEQALLGPKGPGGTIDQDHVGQLEEVQKAATNCETYIELNCNPMPPP